VGSNLASTPQLLSADISPLRRPFRSERFNAWRRPRRATKKPYNSNNNNNNNTILWYYTVVLFVCVVEAKRADGTLLPNSRYSETVFTHQLELELFASIALADAPVYYDIPVNAPAKHIYYAILHNRVSKKFAAAKYPTYYFVYVTTGRWWYSSHSTVSVTRLIRASIKVLAVSAVDFNRGSLQCLISVKLLTYQKVRKPS